MWWPFSIFSSSPAEVPKKKICYNLEGFAKCGYLANAFKLTETIKRTLHDEGDKQELSVNFRAVPKEEWKPRLEELKKVVASFIVKDM
ncbi:hypothetical protein HK102_006795 [Quaeritorhiza haematococci]|nr:hypothetical protein HK102_006795 [Quaeritorhiza haematococci]